MDCPMVCSDGDNNPSCPETGCPLYDGQNDTCFLQQAETCLAGDDPMPTATRAALQRLRDAAHGLLSDAGSLESKLSFLVSEVEERRKSQAQLLQTLTRTEASEGALRGEVRTLADRLAVLETSLGSLEDKLGGVGRVVGTLQTDQFRVAEQLAGDLSRPMEATALRLEEGAAGTRRVLEQFSGCSDNLLTQGREMTRELKTLSERQERRDREEHHRHDALAQKMEQVLRETGALSGQVAGLAAQMEPQLEGARAALETWQDQASAVLESLRQRHVEDERGRQRAREQESRELNARGVLLFHQGSLDAAEQAFRRAVELRPDFAEAHNNLGLVQSRLGQQDEAVESFQKSMSCGQELPAALNNLGFLYHAQMRDAEAVEMFQKALEANPTMAPAFVNLGNAYYRQGNHMQALDSWRRALELDPVNEDAERAIRSFDLQADTARS